MTDGSADAQAAGGREVNTELDRDIGLVGAIALGVGTMMAAGIFVLSGLAVSNVGAAAIVSFMLAAIVASLTAAAYSEFASIYPESGGGYMYVANTFETDLTYIVGWSMILGYPASAAFYLASFSDWFYRFMYPVFNIPTTIPYWIPGLAVLGLLVLINIKGTEETGLFQIVVTALKVVLVLFFIYGGFQSFDASVISESFFDNIGQFQQIGLTSALVFITFFGFEAIATNAEEIEEPGRNIPRAIFISMGFVTIVYAFVVTVIVLAINNPEFLRFLAEVSPHVANPGAAESFIAQNGEVAMGRAAQFFLGDIGFYVIIVGALLSMISAANATIFAGSRVKLAMSRRNHLPSQFEDLHSSLNTPYKSVLLTGGLIVFYIVVFTAIFGVTPGAEAEGAVAASVPFGIHLGLTAVTHFADFMLLGGLIFVNFAIIQSRRKSPDIDRQFQVPFVPWLPIIAVLANLVLLVNVEFTALVIGLLAEVVGVVFWFAVLSPEPTPEQIEEETPTVVAEHEPTDRDYQILVPVANPEHVEQLIETAYDIAEDRDGEILVMSVVTLPEQTPLYEGQQYVEEQREVLDRAMELNEGTDVPISGTVRIGHHAPEAILHTIEQYDSDAVLLGWRGRRRGRRDVVLSGTVDEVVAEADCDVLVEKFGETPGWTVDSILLPTAGGPHAELAAETARSIARATGATVRIMHVVDPDASETDRDDAEEILTETAALFEEVTVETSLAEGEDVANTIVDETGDHDLTVIGATREGFLQQFVFGAIPETVGERAENALIMAKRNQGITSRLKRWLK